MGVDVDIKKDKTKNPSLNRKNGREKREKKPLENSTMKKGEKNREERRKAKRREENN